jgi:chromatin assembly factor 1 subunit A
MIQHPRQTWKPPVRLHSLNLTKLTFIATSDYRAKFLPFTLASTVPKSYFDKLKREFPPLDLTPTTTSLSWGTPKRRGWEQRPMREIMEQLQGSSANAIDLTADQKFDSQEAIRMAQGTAVKFIYFSENVRPAYFGTYTHPISLARLRRLGRSPYSKVHHLNYDYDSEAEWEEDEGDDVASGCDDEEDEEGEDDLDGFVDDEDYGPGGFRKQPVLGGKDLTPVCTGLQWEDDKGVLHSTDDTPMSVDLDSMQMEFLLRKFASITMRCLINRPAFKTIDPLSYAYWEQPMSPPASKPHLSVPGHRPALMDKTKHLNIGPGPSSLKPARFIPDSDLEIFKLAIDGQDLTKIAMIEHLKKLYVVQE